MKKLIKIIITGKVHRVGFRFVSLQMAYEYGIRGFVRNSEDDKVYIEAEGDEESLTKFIKWAKKGPPGSIVKKFETQEGEIKNYPTFDIIHSPIKESKV